MPAPKITDTAPVLSTPRDTTNWTAFIDTIANQMNFGVKFRNQLHDFIKLGDGLSRADLATRTFTLAAIYQQTSELRNLQDTVNHLHITVMGFSERLDENFQLSSEQKINVRAVASDLICDPACISFLTLYIDVDIKLREDKVNLKLSRIYGNPAREMILAAYIKCACSDVRNEFGELLRDSVIGNDTCSLEEFGFGIISKFKRGPLSRTVPQWVLGKLAILRRWAYEHPAYLTRHEDDDDDDDATNLHVFRTTTLSVETEAEPTPSRKRRRTGADKTKQKEAFWSCVEQWFQQKRRHWGENLSTDGWASRIRDTVAWDRAKFQTAVAPNPFMTDMASEGSAATAQNDSSTGHPRTRDLISIIQSLPRARSMNGTRHLE